MGILQSGSEHCRPDEEGSRADITAEHGSAQGKGHVGAVDVATEAEGTAGSEGQSAGLGAGRSVGQQRPPGPRVLPQPGPGRLPAAPT